MKNLLRATAIAMSLLVSACGGGSGDVASTPPPPAPVNTTLTDLKVSQSFVNDAASAAVVFDTATATGVSGTAGRGPLTISYDATTKGYALSYAGRTQAFGTADIVSENPYQAIYRISDDTARKRLNLFKNGAADTAPLKYVTLGFWQHITQDAGQQKTDYTAFAYGLPTVAAEVPRAGKAGFAIEIFGLVSSPAREPQSFAGNGAFTADFTSGLFSAKSSYSTTNLVTDGSYSGGGMELLARGTLSASNGTFSGTTLYGDLGGEPGVLNGRFYGPGAAELGASFSGSGAHGLENVTYVGSMIGLRDTNVTLVNASLINLTSPELFHAYQLNNSTGSLFIENSDTLTYSPPPSDLVGGQFTASDKVASADANFADYRKTFTGYYGDQDARLELYRPGSGNSELALTYASFGHWSASVTDDAGGRRQVDQYFTYGLQSTSTTQIGAKTGTGRYDGVVYGVGSSPTSETRYAIKGTSQINVNFGTDMYSGALAMAGKPSTGGASVNFGSFDFAGPLSEGHTQETGVDLTRNGAVLGRFESRFFGPDGEEIAGPFAINLPADGTMSAVNITGITVAKRQ